MFAWQPAILEQRVRLFEERINDLDVLIQQAELLEANADELTRHYEEERVNAEDNLEVVESDVIAANVLSAMLHNIRPLEDVGADIHRVICQEGIRFSCGNLAAAVGQNHRATENPVL